jgi:phosphoglycolate phosphatase-like HAD superfamily hydrolase
MELQEDIVCVMFDLDGTLGSFPIDYESMRSELRALFSTDSELRPLIPEVRRLADGDSEVFGKAFSIIDRYELASLEKSKKLDKVVKLYEEVCESPKKVAIVTRNGGEMAEEFLKKEGLPLPDLICSRDDVENLKPHPEQMDFIKRRLKVTGRIVLVGDSRHDKELAENTGIEFMDVGKID